MVIIPPIRKKDKWGCGEYQASRGDRIHQGVDIACYEGSKILSITEGKVTKIGFPYSPIESNKKHFRYVEVTDAYNFRFRYFYVSPAVKVGDIIQRNQLIGVSQTLQNLYPGIIDHIHFEVKLKNSYIDPRGYLNCIKN